MKHLVPTEIIQDRANILATLQAAVSTEILTATQSRANLLDSYHAQSDTMSPETQADFVTKQQEYDTELTLLNCLDRSLQECAEKFIRPSNTGARVEDYVIFDTHESLKIQSSPDEQIESDYTDTTMILIPHPCRVDVFPFQLNDYKFAVVNRTHWSYQKAIDEKFETTKIGTYDNQRGSSAWNDRQKTGVVTHIY